MGRIQESSERKKRKKKERKQKYFFLFIIIIFSISIYENELGESVNLLTLF